MDAHAAATIVRPQAPDGDEDEAADADADGETSADEGPRPPPTPERLQAPQRLQRRLQDVAQPKPKSKAVQPVKTELISDDEQRPVSEKPKSRGIRFVKAGGGMHVAMACVSACAID